MQLLFGLRRRNPSDELGYPARRFKQSLRSLEHDADLLSLGVERGDVIGRRLVAAAMPIVLDAVLQEIAVSLPDVILGEGDIGIRLEYEFHDFGIARDLLLIAGGERLDLQPGQQALDVAVGELRAFDAGRGADALDGGHCAQRLESLRRHRADRPPSALELVDPGNESEDFRRDR